MENLDYIHQTYSNHAAFYRRKITPTEWKRLLTNEGDITIRNTKLDAIFMGIWVEHKHRTDILESGFDGFYTYFASDGFSFGASKRNWKNLEAFASEYNLIFSPSIGPG